MKKETLELANTLISDIEFVESVINTECKPKTISVAMYHGGWRDETLKRCESILVANNKLLKRKLLTLKNELEKQFDSLK